MVCDIRIMINPTPERLFVEVSRGAEQGKFILSFITDPDIDEDGFNPDAMCNRKAKLLSMWGRCMYNPPINISHVKPQKVYGIILDKVDDFKKTMAM